MRYRKDKYGNKLYIYPGSEAALGAILAKHGIRDQIYIATKLPHYMIKKPEDMDACVLPAKSMAWTCN